MDCIVLTQWGVLQMGQNDAHYLNHSPKAVDGLNAYYNTFIQHIRPIQIY